MDKELQKQVFEYIKDAAEKIGDFASKEIPPFIHEYLTWKWWEAALLFGSWVVPFFIYIVCISVWLFKIKKDFWKDLFLGCDNPFVFLMVNMFGGIIFGGWFFSKALPSLMTMIQIHVAPKVYILEQIGNHLK